MAISAVPTSPLAARRKLGDELRHLRDQAAMTTQNVGDHLGCHYTKISRIEKAKVAITNRDFDRLMRLYKVKGDKLAELRILMLRGRQRLAEWWRAYGDVLSANYCEFLAYETDAAYAQEYQSVFVPGLLQTRAYAHAVTGGRIAALSPDQVDILVEVRMRRQERLHDSNPIHVDAVIAEGALHLHVGSPAVMREQLRHLATMSLLDNVTLRVAPFSAGENGANTGAFTLFSAGKEQEAEVSFTESTEATRQFQDDPLDVRRLARLFKNLSHAALSEHDSLVLITRIEKELT